MSENENPITDSLMVFNIIIFVLLMLSGTIFLHLYFDIGYLQSLEYMSVYLIFCPLLCIAFVLAIGIEEIYRKFKS